MRVVFMGTPEFAVPVLRRLIADHEVVAVYTRQDAVSRRGRTPVPPPVKVLATEVGIDVHQPTTLRSPDVAAQIGAYAPDVICVAAFGMLLPPDVLQVPRFGCINVHASLLPRYRGAAPVQRAILDGESTTGVSIMHMEEGLDTGAYALQLPVKMDELSTEQLTERLAEVGAEALASTLSLIESGDVVWHPQDDSRATYAPKVSRDDVALDPSLDVETALRRIRASSASATAGVRMADLQIVVLHATRSELVVPPGLAACGTQGPVLGMADGAIAVDWLRPAARNAMSGTAYACGARFEGEVPWERM
ncbi:MAG: methionyl-tRNA formyltransferase [Coriobacteriia bacterium]